MENEFSFAIGPVVIRCIDHHHVGNYAGDYGNSLAFNPAPGHVARFAADYR